ncbi:MAG: amidohydrolase family protein [Cohaesibacteraceae bacterium]|nr:amidohydrolase family protein [Cohaesibacteraceae bacterium]MBL4876430.1 amidohydrolase family protein [Cohaesibacteraceae bacterium]
MKIDAHQHFWKLARGDYEWLTSELAPIYRDFGPADLLPLLKAAGIDGTILVQATDTEEETEYLLSFADKYDWIFGVVGWVDMEASKAPDSIAQFASNPKFCGIRPMIQGLKDDAWMLRPALKSSVSALIEYGLCFDALVLPRHLPHLLRFVETYPDLPVVIDHGAKPEIKTGSFQPWANQIKTIADNSNAFCKLSGLVTEADSNWTASDIKPFARHILECFGPERVMFGSDWPVLNVASDYATWAELAKELCHGNSNHMKAVFGESASRFYLESVQTR